MAKRQAYLVIRPEGDDHQKTVCGYHVREPSDNLRVGDGDFADKFSPTGGVIVRGIKEAKRLSGTLGWNWRQVTCDAKEIEKDFELSHRSQAHDFYGTGGSVSIRETLETLDYEAIQTQARVVRETTGEKQHLNAKKADLIDFIVNHH